MEKRSDSLLEKAISLHRRGDLDDAAALYRELLRREPGNSHALNFLGLLEGQRRDHLTALGLIERALAIEPSNWTFLLNKSEALVRLNRLEDALAGYDRLLEMNPGSAEGLFKCGNLLQKLGRFDDAIASYDRALKSNPNYAGALNNRGNALEELRRFDEALLSYNDALAIRPDYVGALYNKGYLLLQLHRHEEALASFDHALKIDPDYAAALDQRGCALLELHRVKDALASFERALTIKSDPNFHSNLIFALNFDSAADAALQQAERTRWHELHARKFAPPTNWHKNVRDPNRRLRIGYVSSSFSYQAATFAFGGAISCHDRTDFDIVCYSDTKQEDEVTVKLRASVETWRDTSALSDDELAALIEKDAVDILVDCVGHMRGHRLLVFARKPAPIQVTAWGEPTGTGLKTMDYLLADPVLVPANERPLLTEDVYDLPNFLGYWMPDTCPEPSALPALTKGYVTFGSFNRFSKIQEPVLRCWMSILRAVPKSRLLIKLNQRHIDPSRLKETYKVLDGADIERGRVTLLGQSNRFDYLSAYRDVDIALDPFPHSGGMTTLDALWMGVPVVTASGRTISSRLAAASLTALGLTNFIASDVDIYISVAVAKAADISRLSSLRENLRSRIATSAFGDPKRYVSALEAAYRKMWQNWCGRT